MYSVNELVNRLRVEMPVVSHGLFALEEYILLPCYGGNVMLRFNVDRGVSAEEIDGLERELYALLPEGVFADFMGGVYRDAGMDIVGFPEKLADCAERWRDEEIPVSPFADEVNAEAERILALAGLPRDLPVWEIQADDEFDVLVFGDERGEARRYESDGLAVNLFTLSPADRTECEGLVRALFYAKRKGISLAGAVMRISEPTE